MEYPKPVMKLMDMVRELGLPEDYLRRIVHSKYAEKFAFRTSKNGAWMIITAEYEKLRKRGVFG